MTRENSNRDLQSLLDAIKSSDVVENRVQLLAELDNIHVTDKSELVSLVESLIILWEDFTCLDLSQCMLNKSILHVAVKYLDSNISGCQGQFLALGTKASIWCGKHLKMTLMSTGESQEEEHGSLFFQLLLDLLSYTATSLLALAKYTISGDKELMKLVEKFVREQLNLTKDTICEIKRINSYDSEVLKLEQVVLDAMIRLCKVYAHGVNWDLYNAGTKKDGNHADSEKTDYANLVINVTGCAVEKLCEVGTLAANDGGSLVGMLNLSWKGVVTLLQVGKGALAAKVNIADIILTLLSLSNESLRCAAENWSSLLKEVVAVADAKRVFLPVKFYLINAVRIISQYPCQAFSVYKDIAFCVLVILTFRISLSKEERLKPASQVLTEHLEPTSLHLLNSLLNSTQLEAENKFQMLDWLFSDSTDLKFQNEDPSSEPEASSMDAIFCVSSNAMHGARILLLGRVALFINLLRSAPDLEEDVTLGIAKRLGWFFNILVDEDVYSSILVLQIPILHGSGQNVELDYQPMFASIIYALKTFMIVITSSLAWAEMESFLFECLLHPHFLCWEIAMELWCFVVRHAEIDMINDIIDKLCLLLRLTVSPELVFVPCSGVRKLATSICMLLSYGSQSIVDQVYSSLVGTSSSQLSSTMYIALLMEGFPLNLLSDKMKSIAKQRIIAEYFGFLESFNGDSLKACASDVLGAPIIALSTALQTLQVSISDTDMKTLKLLVNIIHKYKNSVDNMMKDHYSGLLCETLSIISHMKYLYASNEMEEVVLELQKLFISEVDVADSRLFQCKPNLALFMAGLGHIDLAENDTSAKSLAVWELYQMLLRERHWAFVHLAITAFGYFAARTSCNQLWRFVPEDAALSFDLVSGNEANEERFMTELKTFLEKEVALHQVTPCTDQLVLLANDGLMLKAMVQKALNIGPEAMLCETMEIDDEKHASKRRKLPDGINKGVALLQSGLKVMGDGLSQCEQTHFHSAELHEKFLAHFSCLEDVISRLVSLTGTG